MALTIDNWMVAWMPAHSTPELDKLRGPRTPPNGAVEVGRWPDKTGWSNAYDSTCGCCDSDHQNGDLNYKVMMMFIDFHKLAVRDGIDPQALHREFLKIDEYRRRIPIDLEGAED